MAGQLMAGQQENGGRTVTVLEPDEDVAL